ncbi:hypothetical protein [Myxococcus sp. RHSTA-1-4]|uniref:hypothetical protein n=1 Tax=Myxococcus sp. RHSTA-1-4 TaxID=2874601 RepID=UPI001CBB7ED4|nr:hypothetical protein [Myxococcus sp. RHSTA-1-4]MBZ4421472.1 hypothetical protein [Myxococcus sp. RHSTA-1-4]
MRRRFLALLVSLAPTSFAQAPATDAPEAAAPAPTPTPEAAAPAPTPAAESPAPTPTAPAPTPRARKPATAPAPASPAAPVAKPVPPAEPPGMPSLPPEAHPANQPEVPAEERARQDIQASARFLFQSLLTGDVRSAAGELMYPFQLEDKRYATPEELVVAWLKQLRLKRTDLITLYDIEVLRLEDMEKKYGKAPARLGLDLRNQKDIWAAVGNLSGRPGVFLFRPYRDEFRAFAYTD